jgi:putative tricarboxylic transport membrane protein
VLIDRVLGSVAILLAAIVGVVSWRYGVGAASLPGPGFWPLLIALSMAGLGAALMARPGPAPSSPAAGASRWERFAVALGTLAFYVLALEPLGYLAATFVLLVVQLRWVEGRSWRGSFLTSALAAAISLIVFRAFLNVPLPQGMLPLPRW